MTADPERAPPRSVEALLTWSLPPGVRREDIVGSLAQEFGERAAVRGRANAVWWYTRQVADVVVRETGARALALMKDGGGGVMAALVQDLRYTFRALRRSPGPYAIALLTVALGVGANAAIFSIVNGVVLEPVPYPDADRLVSVWPEKRWSAPMLADVRDQTESFERVGAALGAGFTLLGVGEPKFVSGWQVSGAWFDVLGARPAVGRLLRQGDEVAADGAVVVLSHGFWLREFGGDASVVGRTIELSGYGNERHQVVGVLSADFEPHPGDRDVWVPLITDPEAAGFRGTYGGSAIATLQVGVTIDRAIEEMRGLIPALRTVHSTQFREVRFSPVDVVPLHESIVRDVRPQLYILLGAVALVLLIACTNVANLLLARATTRRREVGLRLALGADRGRVFRQMVTESLVLGLIGGAAGLAVAVLGLPAMRARVAEYVPRAELIALDARVVAFALAVSLLAGLVFGVVPGLQSARRDPATVLGEYGRSSTGGRHASRINDTLVVLEVGLCMVLVVAAGLMMKSLSLLSDVDPGFQSEGVVAVNVVIPSGPYDEDEARAALFTELLRRIEAVPGVGDGRVATVTSLPLAGGWSGIPYQVRGQEVAEGESMVGGFRMVSPTYFGLLGIERVQGRLLDGRDTPDSEAVAVVNQAFVDRHWPSQSPLGEVILDPEGEELATVVGVVTDARFADLDDEPPPSMYFPADQNGWFTNEILIRTDLADPLSLVDAVRRSIQDVDPNLPVQEPRLLAEVVVEAAGDQRFYALLFGSFAALALVLGLVGVYGVMSYAVGQRTREVGIRMALGATGESVLRTTIQRGLAPVLAGVALGVMGAYAASRFLAAFLFGVTATDPAVYATVAALVVLVGAAAIVVPASRALRLDPVTALRAE